MNPYLFYITFSLLQVKPTYVNIPVPKPIVIQTDYLKLSPGQYLTYQFGDIKNNSPITINSISIKNIKCTVIDILINLDEKNHFDITTNILYFKIISNKQIKL